MNLRIGDPRGLVAYLHSTLSPRKPVLTGERYDVVQTGVGLFYIGDDPPEVGGPFPSMADLLRSEGQRRQRFPGTGAVKLEVLEWDGWFYRVAGQATSRFKQLGTATSPDFELVFQWWEAEDGVFLARAEWERLMAIQDALGATTWGAFEAALPPGEFSSLVVWDEMLYRTDGELRFGTEADLPEDDGEAFVISAEDAFDPYRIPGFGDGDYPPWIDSIARQRLPERFVEAFGRRVESFTSGSWIEYPVARLDEMEEALLAEGYLVTLTRLERP